MTSKPQKPATLKPPTWLTRAEKMQFRRIVEALIEGKRAVSAGDVDRIADYVSARSRVTALRKMLNEDLRTKNPFDSTKALIVSLSRQIDATTTLMHRIAEKIGIGAK
jgi:phage terminase small subunit